MLAGIVLKEFEELYENEREREREREGWSVRGCDEQGILFYIFSDYLVAWHIWKV
jgi:hypothetical protein